MADVHQASQVDISQGNQITSTADNSKSTSQTKGVKQAVVPQVEDKPSPECIMNQSVKPDPSPICLNNPTDVTRPALDDGIWCEECKATVPDDEWCPKHGLFYVIKDRIIPSRAKLTAPHNIAIKTLELRAGEPHVYGVIARKIIQNRTRFGPYEGELTNEWLHNREDRLRLKIFTNELAAMYLDCTNESACNWMMFVRPAQSHEEQNLVAYQYQHAIYFTTIKPIAPNMELKVWYADDYAKLMRVRVFRPKFKPVEKRLHEKGSVLRKQTNLSPRTRTDVKRRKVKPGRPVKKRRGRPRLNKGNKSRQNEQKRKVAKDGLSVVAKRRQSSITKSESLELLPEESLYCAKCCRTFDSLTSIQSHPCYEQTEEGTNNLTFLARVAADQDPDPSFIDLPEDDDVPEDDMDEEASKEEEGRRTRNKRKGTPVKFSLEKEGKVTAQRNSLTGGQENTASDAVSKKKPRGRPAKNIRKLFLCNECQKVFPTLSKLKTHMFTHTGEKPFKCTTCSKSFTTRFKLLRHETIHGGAKSHECRYCSKSFGRKDHLKNHLKVVHDPNKRLFSCDECGKKYASSFAFRTHMAIHAAKRGEMKCGVCKAFFTDETKLMRHLKVHAGARSVKNSDEKRHKCNICKKAFFTPKDLRRHLVVHTKDRMFKCYLCPQQFGRKDHLVRHLKKPHPSDVRTSGPSKGGVVSDDNNRTDNTSNERSKQLPDLVLLSHKKKSVPQNSKISDVANRKSSSQTFGRDQLSERSSLQDLSEILGTPIVVTANNSHQLLQDFLSKTQPTANSVSFSDTEYPRTVQNTQPITVSNCQQETSLGFIPQPITSTYVPPSQLTSDMLTPQQSGTASVSDQPSVEQKVFLQAPHAGSSMSQFNTQFVPETIPAGISIDPQVLTTTDTVVPSDMFSGSILTFNPLTTSAQYVTMQPSDPINISSISIVPVANSETTHDANPVQGHATNDGELYKLDVAQKQPAPILCKVQNSEQNLITDAEAQSGNQSDSNSTTLLVPWASTLKIISSFSATPLDSQKD